MCSSWLIPSQASPQRLRSIMKYYTTVTHQRFSVSSAGKRRNYSLIQSIDILKGKLKATFTERKVTCISLGLLNFTPRFRVPSDDVIVRLNLAAGLWSLVSGPWSTFPALHSQVEPNLAVTSRDWNADSRPQIGHPSTACPCILCTPLNG